MLAMHHKKFLRCFQDALLMHPACVCLSFDIVLKASHSSVEASLTPVVGHRSFGLSVH